MTKLITFFFAICIILGCKKKECPPTVEASLPLSRFALTTNGDTLYNVAYSACDRTAPSVEESIGSNPSLILYSPGMFLPDHIINIPEDLFFDFIFHDVGVQYSGTPFLDEFWTYLENNNLHQFNQEPFKRDFFLKVKKDGKIYQNWWNGGLVGNGNSPYDFSQDETGLEFKNYEFNKFEEFGDICFFDYSVIRLQGEIEGYLITEDRTDTINVEGLLDVFLHLRE